MHWILLGRFLSMEEPFARGEAEDLRHSESKAHVGVRHASSSAKLRRKRLSEVFTFYFKHPPETRYGAC